MRSNTSRVNAGFPLLCLKIIMWLFPGFPNKKLTSLVRIQSCDLKHPLQHLPGLYWNGIYRADRCALCAPLSKHPAGCLRTWTTTVLVSRFCLAEMDRCLWLKLASWLCQKLPLNPRYISPMLLSNHGKDSINHQCLLTFYFFPFLNSKISVESFRYGWICTYIYTYSVSLGYEFHDTSFSLKVGNNSWNNFLKYFNSSELLFR